MAQGALPDQLGRFFEDNGLPKMAGRVLGHLLVCAPPEQTFDEVVAGVAASRSSVSVATRLLIQLGLVERTSVRDDHRDRYAVSPGAWTTLLQQDIAAARRLKSLADEGLLQLSGQPKAVRARLLEMRRFYTFLDDAYTPILARWQKAAAAGPRRRRS